MVRRQCRLSCRGRCRSHLFFLGVSGGGALVSMLPTLRTELAELASTQCMAKCCAPGLRMCHIPRQLLTYCPAHVAAPQSPRGRPRLGACSSCCRASLYYCCHDRFAASAITRETCGAVHVQAAATTPTFALAGCDGVRPHAGSPLYSPPTCVPLLLLLWLPRPQPYRLACHALIQRRGLELFAAARARAGTPGGCACSAGAHAGAGEWGRGHHSGATLQSGERVRHPNARVSCPNTS